MEETKEIMGKEASELSLMNEESKDAEVLYEDVSRRKENTKHFRMKNGNFMAVVYDEPVHKLNEKTGKLEEIKEEFTETEEEYEASTKHFKVKLPKKEGRRKFVTVEKDGKSVSFRFASGKPTHTKRPEAKMHSVKKHYWEHKKYPTVKYEKVDNITSLEYEVNDGGIKENIVLTKCPETSTFKFDMMCNGLTPKLSENKKRVILLDENEEAVMVIPPANMTDDNGVYSEEIHYELCETENGTTLEMVVENDWLSAYERKYPVTIDPRVDVIGGTANETIMKQICSNGSTFMTGESFKVGIDANGNIHRVYMNVPVPEIESNAKIIKAELKFYMDSEKTVYDGNPYKVYYSNSTVNISNLNWYNQATIMGADLICTFRPYNTYETIDITKLIKNARENSQSSKLIVFKHSLEEPSVTYPVSVMCVPGEGEDNEEPTPTPTPVTTYEKIYIYSSTADISKRPVAFVEYVSADKTVQYKKQYSFNCGDAGAASIDLATGSLTFVHDDAIGKSFRFTPPVAHIYKSVNADNETNNGFGIGWMLSPIQSFEYYGGSSDYVAKYTDSSGNVYYFVLNSDGTVTDELGMGLTLTTSHRTEGTTFVPLYYIEDEYDNKIEFVDYNNRIIQFKTNQDKGFKVIKNINGLYGTIMEDTISGIDNSKAVLEYSSNKLNSIKEYINETIDSEATMTYLEQYLSSITAANNKTTRFTYKGKYLGEIIDYKGIIYEFFYDDHGRVVAILTKGNSTDPNSQTVGEMVGIEYRNKSTVIKNLKTGVKTVYVLDEYGRERYSYLDISEAVDNTKITETTLLDFKGYTTTRQASGKNANGVYVSMSATVDKDASYQKNYFSNGCFEGGISDWTVSGTIQPNSESLKYESYIPGSKSFYFNSSSGSYNKWISKSASFNLSEISGDMLVASAWCKSIGHSPLVDSLSSFKMIVRITYNDGTFNEYVENYDVACHTWQCAAIPIKVDKTKSSATVLIKLDYSNNIGVCYFTNVRLVEADATYIENEYYDTTDDSNKIDLNIYSGTHNKIPISMKSVTENKCFKKTEYYGKNSDKICEKIIDKTKDLSSPDREFTSCWSYDNNHKLMYSRDNDGVITEYTYNGDTEVIIQKYTEANRPYSKRVKVERYDSKGRLIVETDPRCYIESENPYPLLRAHKYEYNEKGLVSSYVYPKFLKSNETSYDDAFPDCCHIYHYSYNNQDDLDSVNVYYDNHDVINKLDYTNGYLTKLSIQEQNYKYVYDEIGRLKQFKINNDVILTNEYINNSKSIVKTTYANGTVVETIYNEFGNPISVRYNEEETPSITIEYDGAGKIKTLVDNKQEIRYNYIYSNSDNNLESIERYTLNGNELIWKDSYYYESNGIFSGKAHNIIGHSYYTLNDEIGLNGKYMNSFTKDSYFRPYVKTLDIEGNDSLKLTETYEYYRTPVNGSNFDTVDHKVETNYVSKITYCRERKNSSDSSTDIYEYKYDDLGRIVEIYRDGDVISKYIYDELNRIRSEYNYKLGEAYHFDTYDDNGNIIDKCVNSVSDYTTYRDYTYQYSNSDWKDQLTSYNGTCFSYDECGYPTVYRSNDLEWENGKHLKKFNNYTYTYGADGIRTSKTIDGVEHKYVYDGTNIVKETYGNNALLYYYGMNGIVGINYNGTDYYFRKNIFGDVIAIYSSNGYLVAEYAYNAFGEHKVFDSLNQENTLANFIGNINPIRYRSYYYDKETGLYYLNSRYYDPEVGRFISPANISELNPKIIGGLNLYSYANNNPISRIGSSGTSVNRIFLGSSSEEYAGGLFLNIVDWLIGNSTTIYSSVHSLVTGIPILSHYFKYSSFINDEFKLYGISKWKTSLELSNVNFKIGALDGILIVSNVLIDMYDSWQRGVSTEGIILGGTLTAASNVGMLYLNKGIMWSTTTIGTAICPGIGTAIGFGVGLVGSILVDIFLGGWIADWIDNNIK